jgi:hypothetical protein
VAVSVRLCVAAIQVTSFTSGSIVVRGTFDAGEVTDLSSSRHRLFEFI